MYGFRGHHEWSGPGWKDLTEWVWRVPLKSENNVYFGLPSKKTWEQWKGIFLIVIIIIIFIHLKSDVIIC